MGDAAYCATPIAGKGTDLAMSGAYLLAGELSRAQTYREAFDAYENKMRPYVKKCQKLPPGIPNLVYPQSRIVVAILNKIISLAGSKPAKWVMGLFGSDKKAPQQEIVLPEYRNQ